MSTNDAEEGSDDDNDAPDKALVRSRSFIHTQTQNHIRIMFKSHFTHALLMGKKKMTCRIGWKPVTVLQHLSCFDRGELVRVWVGQGDGSSLGYLLYTDIWEQTVGELTLDQVRLEGVGDMGVYEFQRVHLQLNKVRKKKPTVTLLTSMVCLRFNFFPLIGHSQWVEYCGTGTGTGS